MLQQSPVDTRPIELIPRALDLVPKRAELARESLASWLRCWPHRQLCLGLERPKSSDGMLNGLQISVALVQIRWMSTLCLTLHFEKVNRKLGS